MNEDDVRKGFVDVPSCSISSKEDVKELLNTARSTMEDTNLDWKKRQIAVTSVRSVVVHGGMDFECELIEGLRLLEESLIISVTDLRSQVCKEASITICMLAEKFGPKLPRLFERLLSSCLPLIQISVKIMANSGSQACGFIVKNVHTPKIMTILVEFRQHKAKEIRSNVFQLMTFVLSSWQPQKMEKHMDDIVSTIKLALGDADPIGRKNGREGYQLLEEVFPHRAQLLFKSLDASKQKYLSGRASASVSTQSLTSLRDSTPLTKRPSPNTSSSRPTAFLSGRSTSAIDASSVKKATNSALKSSLPSVYRRTPVAPRSTNISQPSSPTLGTYHLPFELTPSPANRKTSNEDAVLKQITNLSIQDKKEDDWSGSSLENAIKKCTMKDPLARKDGLTMVHEIIRTSLGLTAAEAKAIAETLIKLLSEHSHKTVTPLTDALCDLVREYHVQIGDQLFPLLSRLLPKYSQEIMPNVRNSFKKLLDQARGSFGHSEQLVALCQFIDGRMTSPHTPKARMATVIYLMELVSAMESGSHINRPEVQTVVRKIFQWMEDPKNADVKPSCEQLINAFFTVNAADFSEVLTQLPRPWQDHALSFLQKNGERDCENVEEVPAERADSRPITPSLGPIYNNSSSSESVDIESDMSNLENTRHLANNDNEQTSYIKLQLKELSFASNDSSRTDEQHVALSTLQQMVSEGSFTTWEVNFKPMLLQLFDLLSLGKEKKHMQLKKDSLRLIGKLCRAQATRFYEFGTMVIKKVLDTALGVEDSWFLNVVDECLRTFSTHLPIEVVLTALNPIIASKTDPRIPQSLKMLQRLVEHGDSHSLKQLLPEFVPGIVGCHDNIESSVRKNTVFTLVALVNKVGRQEIDPYMDGLEPKVIKLMDLYIKKTEAGADAHH